MFGFLTITVQKFGGNVNVVLTVENSHIFILKENNSGFLLDDEKSIKIFQVISRIFLPLWLEQIRI